MDLDVIVLCLRTVVVTEVVRMNEFAVESSVKVVLDLEEKIRVLHVDDDSAILRITKQCLEMEGPVQVETALSVEEALTRLEKEKFDVVVSDYQMPGKDGLEFLKILREKGNMIPFIFLTGKGREEIAIKALNLGANQYLNRVGETEIVYAELAHSIMELIRVRKAEKAIQESNSKFESLFFGNPEAAVYLDLDFHILDVNPCFSELFGYALEEAKGRTLLELIVPEDKSEEGKTLDQKAANGYVYYDSVRKRKDGSLLAVSISAAPIIIEGKLAGYVGIYKDMPQQKKMEQSLRESEEKLKAIIEHTRSVYYSHGLDNVLTYISPQVKELSGYAPEEALVKWPDFLSDNPANLKGVELTQKAIDAGEPQPPYELEFVRKDGHKVWVEIRESPVVRDGKTIAIVGVATDITDRKKAEQGFQESKHKFEGLFFGNPEAAAYLEPDSRILNVNPRFEELFGYSLEEIKGRHINDVIVQKAKKEEAETLDRKAVEGYVYFNTERRRKDGFAVPVAVSAAPIKAEGKLVGIVAMYKDISQLKSAEKRLVTLNEKLQVVGQLTRHDVRNKLSTIIGNAYLLKKQFVGDGRVLDKLKDMETAVQQITKIFEFAKTYESLDVEELTYMDVAKSVDEAAALFPDLKGAKMTNNCYGLMVLADSLLRQLFYNLVDNSLKYGKKTKMIKVYYEADGRDKLRLVYEDDGVGISEAEKPKLFKEGYSTGGSTGYGLYLIKKMTEVYGWTIEETGEPGKGAQFTITVPKVNQNGKEIYRIAKSSSYEAPSTS